MKAFVTGATGFLGGRVAEKLRERGDEVVALARSAARAGPLSELGCDVLEGDLGSRDVLRRGLDGAGAVFHVAAIYRIGVPTRMRERMFEANVNGTLNVLDAAAEAGTSRIVYVSTNNVLGNTRGQVVDERHERTDLEWLSVYDETKYVAHLFVKERIAAGAPVVIVQPGGIYGPGDHTEMGGLLERATRGKIVLLPFGAVGLNFAYVDDVADGILLAHERGEVGETYILGGEIARLRDAVEKAFAVVGARPRIVPVPTRLVRLATPFGRLLGMNVREFVSASAGVTYWGRDDKARRELGYRPRNLEEGLRLTFAR